MKWSDHPNLRRWLKAPTIEQIDAVVKKSGVSELQFERFHNIYPGVIRNIRWGSKRMPVQHWHLFLDPQNSIISNSIPKTTSFSLTKRTKPKSSSSLSKLIQ